jgi:hypothetical protein
MSNGITIEQTKIPSLVDPDTGLDERETFFLDILFDECDGDVIVAMDKSGFPKDMSPAKVRKKLGPEIRQAAKDYLQASAGMAAVRLTKVFKDPTLPGTDNIIKASKEVLDRVGIVKEEIHVVPLENIMIMLPPKSDSSDLLRKSDDKEMKVINH